MHFKPLCVRVLLQNDDYVKALEQQAKIANERAATLEQKYMVLESKYADISHVNLEMIDILKSNGIKYRPGVDSGTWNRG